MFGRKQRRIAELTARLAAAEAANAELVKRAGELWQQGVDLDARNAKLRRQIHLLRLGEHPPFPVDDPIATAEQFGAVESRFGFTVEVSQ